MKNLKSMFALFIFTLSLNTNDVKVTNAMSDNMQSAMLRADDAYAGSETFYRMQAKLEELTGIPHLLPAHQGRACENIIATRFVKPGNCVIMNYHFTTAKAHITRLGGRVEELVRAEGLIPESSLPFKGNILSAFLSNAGFYCIKVDIPLKRQAAFRDKSFCFFI